MASVDQLETSLKSLSADSFQDEADRIRARDLLFEALRRVQSPWDIAWEHCWVSGTTNAAIKTLIDCGLWKAWAEVGGKPSTSPELAKLVGADVPLVRRLLRHLAGQHLVTETSEDTYAPTPWATACANRPFPSMYGGFLHEFNQPLFENFPKWAKETGYKNPTDVKNCNFQHWKGPDANQFVYIGTNPALTSDFNDAMECHSKYNLTAWPEVYPTDTVVAAARPNAPLVVDVGGGQGHDLEKFAARHPDVPSSSLILQDLPGVLEAANLLEEKDGRTFTVQPHDFFTPEPVKGARVYFMHNVLHDWPDETATAILKNIAGAMEKGYSRLLIHESLVSNVKPLARVTTSDLTMMMVLAAKERTEGEWEELVRSAGLKVVKIWRPTQSVESVIEVELE